MDMIKNKYIFPVSLIACTVLSFVICLASFNAQVSQVDASKPIVDTLSGEEYITADTNYLDNNPYGSFFVGFNILSDAGVTSGDMTYMQDALINFAMYNEKVYNGKISYVKDSYKKTTGTDEYENIYEYKFGLNDGNIHTMKVRSSWLNSVIDIKIIDSSDKEAFAKKFRIYTN